MADLKISVDIDASGTKKGAAEAKAAIKSVADEAQKAGRNVKSVAEQDLGKLGTEASKAAAAVTETSGSLSGLAAIGGPVTAIIAAIGAALLVVVGVALTLAREITHLVAAFVEYTKAVGEASSSSGISVRTMSALRAEVELLGGKFSDVTGGIENFVKTIGDANNGSKEASAKLARLGIDAQKAERDINGAFAQVVKKIAEVPEGIQRTNAAIDAFGQNGLALLPLIKKFGGNIDEVIKAATEMGLVLSDSDVKAAAQFDQSLRTVNKSLESLKLQLGREFLPTVQKVLDGINTFLANNRDQFSTWATTAGNLIAFVAAWFPVLDDAVAKTATATRITLAAITGGLSEVAYLIAKITGSSLNTASQTGGLIRGLDRLKSNNTVDFSDGVLLQGQIGTDIGIYNRNTNPPKTPKAGRTAAPKISPEDQQRIDLIKQIKDANIELDFFGQKSEEAAVKQQLLKKGIFDVNQSLADSLIALAKDKDAKIAAAAATELGKKADEKLAAALKAIKASGAGEQAGITGDIAKLDTQISLGRELNDVEAAAIDNRIELVKLGIQMKADGFKPDEIKLAQSVLSAEQQVTLELIRQRQSRQDNLEAIRLTKDLSSGLDEEIQALNVQLGLSAELSRADAVAKQLQGDAYKNLTKEQKDGLIAQAQTIDQLQQLRKEQEASKRQYEELFGTIRDSLQTLADQGFGAFFKSIQRKFQAFLLDLVAQWLTSKFFSLFYKGGNVQTAQQNGQGGGGILGGILPAIFGQGAAQQQGGGSGSVFNSPYILNSSGGGNGGLVLNTGNLPGAPGSPSNPGGGGGFGGLLGGITIAGGLATLLGGAIGGRTGGFISNIGSGAALGAQIGSIIPGIGTLIGAGIGAAVGFFASLFGGDPKQKRDKNEKLPALTAGFTDALQQLRQLIEDVRTLRVSPDSALAKATELRGQIASGFGIQFESKKYQRSSQQQIAAKLVEADALIAQLRDAADVARAAGERDRRILPEFANGVYLSPAFQSFRRQNGMLGGVYTGRDTVPSMLSPGEMVLNPSQMGRVIGAAGFDVFKTAGIPGYASGGVVQPTTVQNGPVNLTINLSQDAEGMWTATAESDAGQKVIAKVVSNAFRDDTIKTKRR